MNRICEKLIRPCCSNSGSAKSFILPKIFRKESCSYHLSAQALEQTCFARLCSWVEASVFQHGGRIRFDRDQCHVPTCNQPCFARCTPEQLPSVGTLHGDHVHVQGVEFNTFLEMNSPCIDLTGQKYSRRCLETRPQQKFSLIVFMLVRLMLSEQTDLSESRHPFRLSCLISSLR